jgi:SAM-dependent methyltransferase
MAFLANRICYRLAWIMRCCGAVVVLSVVNAVVRRVGSWTHLLQRGLLWGVKPNPEWFDHFFDAYGQWLGRRPNPLWVERGVFNLLHIRGGASVLELCCGDGYNAFHFYAPRAGSVQAVDFDAAAIRHARRFFPRWGDRPIRFAVADIRSCMPEGHFDNVIWDAAIEHFTLAEIRAILRQIATRLGTGGVLSGYTIERQAQGKSHDEHEHEFATAQELEGVLGEVFAEVNVFRTVYPERVNLYFAAAQSPLQTRIQQSGQDLPDRG